MCFLQHHHHQRSSPVDSAIIVVTQPKAHAPKDQLNDERSGGAIDKFLKFWTFKPMDYEIYRDTRMRLERD